MPAESIYVFDACAVIALLEGEPGAEKAARLLQDPANRCLIHAVNICEIYYDMIRRSGEARASSLEKVLEGSGFELRDTLPSALWRLAGKLKAELRRVSLADCFAMALTLQEKGRLVTTDHHEFDPIAAADICPIYFIR